LWEPSKIEGSIDIYPYVFGWHSVAANLIEYSDPILTEEYKNSPSVVINLDAPHNIVDKLDVDFSYRKISNLTYCIPAACWEKQNTKDLGLTGADSQGALKTNTDVEVK
jgi:hypothetical protein